MADVDGMLVGIALVLGLTWAFGAIVVFIMGTLTFLIESGPGAPKSIYEVLAVSLLWPYYLCE